MSSSMISRGSIESIVQKTKWYTQEKNSWSLTLLRLHQLEDSAPSHHPDSSLCWWVDHPKFTYACKKITIHPIHPGQPAASMEKNRIHHFPSEKNTKKTSSREPEDPITVMTRSLLFSTLVQTWLERNQLRTKKNGEEGLAGPNKNTVLVM